MKKIHALVTQHYYQDDYTEGEIEGTYGIDEIAQESFDSLEAAVKWFRGQYDGEMDAWDNVVCIGLPPQAEGDYCFTDAMQSDIEEWKLGKRKLWNVEYQMRLSVTEPLTVDREAVLEMAK